MAAGHDDGLAYVSASELGDRIRRRELSPVEVLDDLLGRIEARNPSINAFVHVAHEEARAAARSAERRVMRGDELGPLHGVPTAIKDLFDFKPGWPATYGGIRALRDFTVDAVCSYTERMERAGAILVGRTNSPVLGFRGTCDNPLFGPTHNPFDLSRNSGGSSGGSAAAVADGLLPVAEGTDGGGSIRIPASWCGIYGFKASFGRVPSFARPNAFGTTSPFTHEGPLTRTVADAALALSILAGRDDRDPLSIDGPQDFVAATRASIRGWRIAYCPDYGVFPVDPQVNETVERAVRVLAAAGAHVEPVDLPLRHGQRELSDLWCRLVTPSNIRALERLEAAGYDLLGEHADDLPPELRSWLERCHGLTAVDVLRDQEIRTHVFDAVQAVLRDHRLIVGPTLAALPVKNAADGNTVGPGQVAGVEVDPLIGWCPTYLVNYTGNPAASVPAGLSDAGLPVGMQIVGRQGADVDVLTASAVFEEAQPWSGDYRRCAERSLEQTPAAGV